jgi:hypothetical protein
MTDIDETANAPDLEAGRTSEASRASDSARGPRLDPIDESKDWLGYELSCADCAHAPLAASGGCRPRHACVQDRYARRIDRFFRWNPALAKDYLGHLYFEVRAVAAKHADVFHLPALLADPDATVRWSAAARLPRRFLLRLREDPDREVRIRVAVRLDGTDLVLMLEDSDYYVRQTVARRITPSLLSLMVHDPDAEVRRVVAGRIGAEWLMPMAADTDAGVRLVIAGRLAPNQLGWLAADPDWRVRYEVAGRLDAAQLAALLDDPDPMVCERVHERLVEAASAASAVPPAGDNGARIV